jgi:hypothetical protein
MLPLDAILQDPKRTTNGSSELLNSEEIGIIAELAKRTIKVLMAQGNSEEKATCIVLSSEPFIYNTDAIRRYLKNN